MKKSYCAYKFTISPQIPGVEILIAQLSEAGFASFAETDDGLLAYIPSEKNEKTLLKDVAVLKSDEFEVAYTQKTIPQKDWNASWERRFTPIEVEGICQIRSPKHPSKNLDYEILINPKMAFGTGHHATTYLMVKSLLYENVKGKRVLDMGCGTGILAILASRLNASAIHAIDIDAQSCRNTQENIALNQCENIFVEQGSDELLKGLRYNLITANITRNILLEQLPQYVTCLTKNGVLLLSGFLQKDVPLLKKEGQRLGLRYHSLRKREDWVAIKMLKD